MSSFERVELSEGAADAIRRHAEKAYPEEACGFLIGPAPDAEHPLRRIEVAEPVENEKMEERTHRFLVSPLKVKSSEERWEGLGKSVVGIYHSHPDHPAEPSKFDLENGLPWYTYILVGVDKGRSSLPNAFEINDERTRWQQRPLEIIDAPKNGRITR